MSVHEPINGQANELPWYALYTRHQHEKTVARILESQGFEIFLPVQQTAHQWKDRMKPLSLPLFPCYVFLKGDLQRRVDIVKTPGLHAIVSSGGQPAAIPPVEMETLRRVVESGACAEPHPFLKCGDLVRIKRGPLTGIEGILVRKKNIYRLILSVEMLAKSVAVEVDALLVEPLNGGSPVPSSIGDEASFRLSNSGMTLA